MRLVKSEDEIEKSKRACRRTSELVCLLRN